MQVLHDRVVFVSENKTEDLRWGYYQFPSLNYSVDGNIYLFIQAKLDAFEAKGEKVKQPLFRSTDGGKTFVAVDREEVFGGKQLLLGRDKIGNAYYSFLNTYGLRSSADNAPILTEKPLACGYGEQKFRVHPFTALPKEERVASLHKLEDGESKIITGEVQGLERVASLYAEYNYTIDEWKYHNNFLSYAYTSLIHANHAFYCVVAEPTEHKERLRHRLNILKSENEGKTWQSISVIEPSNDMYWGFTDEVAIQETNNGKLVIIARLLASHKICYAHHLACYISQDKGKTWVEQPPLSEFSVRPKLIKGKTEIAAIYGRPGIYYKTSKDGVVWSESQAIFGPREQDYNSPISQEVWDKEFMKYSCGNASVLPLKNQGEYLLAYSNFMYEKDGAYHKAIHLVDIKLD